MLNVSIDEKNGIAFFRPDEKLSESDFKSAVSIIDPYIKQFDKLNGLVIATEAFPGWESFAALLSHISFVKDHHKKILFVALVTDSPVGNFGEHIANHFVSAQIRSFKYSELEAAKNWIIESSGTG